MHRLFFLAVIFLSSCGAKLIPLKNNYPTGNYEIKSNSEFEMVWGNIIELFAKNGIGVKLLDKASGFIVAQNTTAPVTTENKSGELVNPGAWLVSPKSYDPGPQRYYYPTAANIEWNIYIKKDPASGTLININLTSANSVSYSYTTGMIYQSGYTMKSTGVFEKFIADKIK